MSAAPGRKSLDEYEYTVKVHEVDPDTGEVTLLFEEVDGLDGFAVRIGRAELARLMQSGGFDDWAEQQVEARLELLRGVVEREEKRRAALDEVKEIKEALEKKRLGPPRRKRRKKRGGRRGEAT